MDDFLHGPKEVVTSKIIKEKVWRGGPYLGVCDRRSSYEAI